MEYAWVEYVIASKIILVRIVRYPHVWLGSIIIRLLKLADLPAHRGIIRIYTRRRACLVIRNALSVLFSQLYAQLAILMRLIPKSNTVPSV